MSKVPRGFTGHPRDALKLQVVPDPKVTIGPFRILQRVDGMFVVFDARLPLGKAADDRAFVTLDAAKACAQGMAEREEKQPDAPKPYDWDAEWFAGMRRALANGFPPHEPAYSAEELREQHELADGGRKC